MRRSSGTGGRPGSAASSSGGGSRRGSASSSSGNGPSSMDLDAAAARAAPVQSADQHGSSSSGADGSTGGAHRSALRSSITRHDALLGDALESVAEEGTRRGGSGGGGGGRAPAMTPAGGGGGRSGGGGRGFLAEVNVTGGAGGDEATVMAVGRPERTEDHASGGIGGGGIGRVPRRVSTDSSAITAITSNQSRGGGGGRGSRTAPPNNAAGGRGPRRGSSVRGTTMTASVGPGGGPHRGSGVSVGPHARGSRSDHQTVYSAPGVLNRNQARAELPLPPAGHHGNPQGPNGYGHGDDEDESFHDEPHIPMSSAAAAIMMAANRTTPSERRSSHNGSGMEGSYVASSERQERRTSETLHSEPLPKRSRFSASRRGFVLPFGKFTGAGRGGRDGGTAKFRERAYGASVAVLCFGVSLLVAAFYGQGRMGRGASGMIYTGLRPEDGGAASAGANAGAAGEAGASMAPLPSVPDLVSMNIALPASIETNYADTSVPFPRGAPREHLAVFWQIPRSGGNAVKAVLGRCRGLIEASELAASKGNDKTLKIYETTQGTRFVNVDPTTPQGIEHGIALQLATAAVADVAFTPLLHPASSLFSAHPSDHPGRLFAIFRHPVERAASQFHRDTTAEPSLADMTLVEYVRGGRAGVDNWMTRALTSKGDVAEITEDDLLVALEILRRKVLVGLADRVEESLERFEAYFGWDGDANSDSGAVALATECRRSLLAEAGEVHGPGVEEGSEGWKLLMARNAFDVRVYEYARYLYSVHGTRG